MGTRINNGLLLGMLFLTACGGEDSADSASTVSHETPKKSQLADKPDLGSIMLATKDDLPACEEANNTQLAYIKDEKQFYVCENGEWETVSIQGENGKDGKDGEDAPIANDNEWTDSISGLTWFIGGVGTYAQAQSSCIGLYRMPTEPEAFAAINHGLLTKINPQVLWMGNGWAGGLSGGVPSQINVVWASGQSIACVKN